MVNMASTCTNCHQIQAIYAENNGLCLVCKRKLMPNIRPQGTTPILPSMNAAFREEDRQRKRG